MDTCEFDGAEIRCTWWGFEFDYHGASSGVPLVCVWERTLPSDEGNYDGVRRRNATTDTIEVQLPSDSGHLFHPAFEGFPRQLTAAWVPVQLTWDCSYQGRPAFSLAHRLIFSSSFR